MIDPNKKEELPINPSQVCMRAFELMKAKQYDNAEKLLHNNLTKTEDKVALALYHSALGVLFKLKTDFKTAWKHYERAEKLLPDDPALKIISARLQIEHFSQHDQAIKRAKKVLKIVPKNPVFVHQAFITMGIAYARKRDEKKAVEMLKQSIVNNFEGFITSKNIDFHLVEMLLRNAWGIEDCRLFLTKACDFAKAKKEKDFEKLFQKMLDTFEMEYKK